MVDYKYKQGELVSFLPGQIEEGKGRICGVSFGVPVLGTSYILEVLEYKNPEIIEYPYTHISVFEKWMNSLDSENLSC